MLDSDLASPAKLLILHKTHRCSRLRLQRIELFFFSLHAVAQTQKIKKIPSVQFQITPKPHQTCKHQLSQAHLQKRMQNQAQQNVYSKMKCFLQKKHKAVCSLKRS